MKALKAIVCAAAAMLSLAAVAQKPLVVAHRGYWKTGKGIKMQTATESAQNSIRSARPTLSTAGARNSTFG